jgi:hypothetical protein
MQLFVVAFQSPVNFVIFSLSTAMAGTIIVIALRAVLTTEGRSRMARAITNPNAKLLFTLLFIAWAVVFGLSLQLVPHVGASSPYGAIGLIGMFVGFFIMMGLLWAVIGE